MILLLVVAWSFGMPDSHDPIPRDASQDVCVQSEAWCEG